MFSKIVHFTLEDVHYAEAHNRIFRNPLSLKDLPPEHSYNYVLTTHGDLIFGMVINGWEFGVKHLILAQGHDVVVSGEFYIHTGHTYEFNLMSGSLMLAILLVHPDYEAQLIQNTHALFYTEYGINGQFSGNQSTLLPLQSPPSQEEIASICAFGSFARQNPSICTHAH